MQFGNNNGDEFTTFEVSANYSHDTRDNRILPTRGSVTRLSGEIAVPGGDLTFFKTELSHSQFLPLFSKYILNVKAEIGYGSGYGDTEDLPLYENFLRGGWRLTRCAASRPTR